MTLPGWRDFERAVALAFGGSASESKDIFDVVMSRPEGPPLPLYGLSCKMRSELNRQIRKGRDPMDRGLFCGRLSAHLRASSRAGSLPH